MYSPGVIRKQFLNVNKIWETKPEEERRTNGREQVRRCGKVA